MTCRRGTPPRYAPQQRGQQGVLVGGVARHAGHAEGRQRGGERGLVTVGEPAEELRVLGVGARPPAFEVVHAQAVHATGDTDLVLDGQVDPFALGAIAQRRVVQGHRRQAGGALGREWCVAHGASIRKVDAGPRSARRIRDCRSACPRSPASNRLREQPNDDAHGTATGDHPVGGSDTHRHGIPHVVLRRRYRPGRDLANAAQVAATRRGLPRRRGTRPSGPPGSAAVHRP
jgi:hypothetical protein